MLAIAVIAILAGILIAAIALYEHELRRMARFLRQRDSESNERVAVEFSTPGISDVAHAINSQLDHLRDERSSMEERRVAFQKDLASLSHDIRTPLTGAQGYLQLYGKTRHEDERARYVSEAIGRLDALRELTDRLFDYSKAADPTNAIELQPVRIFDVLSEVLAGTYPSFEKRGWAPVVVFPREDEQVLADEEALARIIENLVSNALRHGSSAPRIEQTPGGLAVSNEVAHPEFIDPAKLFDRFYRVDASRAGGGSGLGLAIVARLCERMGGYAQASVDGRILRITVTLRQVQ